MKKREKIIWDIIEKKFNTSFPKFKLIKREKYIPKIGYIDFYWIVPWTNKVFIIELKTFSNNPNIQLIWYKWWVKEILFPGIKDKEILLIWINEKLNKNLILNIPNIEYYQFNLKEETMELKYKTFFG